MACETREEILSLLPHRDPFLFVDRIVERKEGSITCEWDIRADLDCLRGHYPGQPILPGVMISEFVFQSGALLVYGSEPELQDDPGAPVLTRIEDARFKRIVRPGATLRVNVKHEERLANARYLSAKVTTLDQAGDKKTVARLRFVLAIAPAEGA